MISTETKNFCKSKALEYRNIWKESGRKECVKKQSEDCNKNVLNALTCFLSVTLADFYISVDDGTLTREDAIKLQKWLFENTDEVE